MIFGPCALCLMALAVLAQGAAVDPQQPPLQTNHHGGPHAPIKVAKRQENVENAELVNDGAEEMQVQQATPLIQADAEQTAPAPAAVSAGVPKTARNSVCMKCSCPP
jgi:hypothetical protein